MIFKSRSRTNRIKEFKNISFRKSTFANVQPHLLCRSVVSHVRANVDPYICNFGSN